MLKLGGVVCEAGGVLKHGYFPQGTVLTLLTVLENGSAIETANVPAQGHDRIELAHHALAQQRGVHQRRALSREIVDHRED